MTDLDAGRGSHPGAGPRPAASPDGWPAPLAPGPLQATVAVPGSKSWTNRWLTLAALASGPSTLHSPLDARDTQLMAGALRAFGHDVRTDAGSTGVAWRVTPAHGWHAPAEPIDCGLAGTVLRFLVPLASLAHGPVTFTGDERLGHRPLEPLLDAVRSLGLTVTPGAGTRAGHSTRSVDAGAGVLPLLVAGALHPSDPDDATVDDTVFDDTILDDAADAIDELIDGD